MSSGLPGDPSMGHPLEPEPFTPALGWLMPEVVIWSRHGLKWIWGAVFLSHLIFIVIVLYPGLGYTYLNRGTG